MLLLAVWLVLPVLASFRLRVGSFEVSIRHCSKLCPGLTTTGRHGAGDLSGCRHVIFWRALLQWFGGALTLLTAVLVLAPFGVLSTPINITIPGYERDDLAKSVVATGRHILPTYTF